MKFSNINKTLDRYLFNNQLSIDKSEQKKIRKFLFPCERDIRRFLKETDYQEKIELAKQIIGRISYEMTTGIPPTLVSLILDYETRIAPDTKNGDHVSRDHYIHLVYTYLLGIYIYSQHRSINILTNSEFSKNKNASPLRDFSLAWKFFSLGHDLGYILESVYYNKGSDSKSTISTSMCLKYERIHDYICNHLSLKILSKLMTLKELYQPSANHLIKEFILAATHLNTTSENKDIQNKDIHELLTPPQKTKRICFKTEPQKFKLMMALYQPEHITASLENNKGDIILVISLANGTYQLATTLPSLLKTNITSLWEQAFSAFKSPKQGYTWHYYFHNPSEQYNQFINSFFEPEVASTFQTLTDLINEEIPIQLRTISTDEHIKAYGYHIYNKIDNLFSNPELNAFTTSDFTRLSTSAKLSTNHVTRIIKSISEEIKSHLTSHQSEIKLTGTENLQQITEKTLNIIFSEDSKATFIKNVTAKAQAELSSEYAILCETPSSWNTINSLLKKFGKPDASFTSPSLLKQGETYKSLVDNQVFINRHCTLSNKSYTNYISPDHIDHGVSSACIVSYVMSFYKSISEYLSDSNNKPCSTFKLLQIGCDILSLDDIATLARDINDISRFAIDAIFNHNLNYHQICQTGEHNTFTLKERPFVFLSILTDEVQNWDRKRNANFAHYNSGHNAKSSEFDIHISNDYIYIHDSGPNLVIESIASDFKKNINAKLYRGLDLIRLSLQQE